MGNRLPPRPQPALQAPPPVAGTVLKTRLSPEEYAALERKAGAAIPVPNERTTDTQMAFAAGVEHCLRVLREGWVIGL